MGPSSRRLANRPPSRRVEATFGFIDVAGFTALAETHGDDDAAGLATRLAQLTRTSLGERDRLVKTITDAIAAAARDKSIAVIGIGNVVLKNVSGSVALSSLGFMVGAIDSAMDPVCQSIVDRRAAVGQLRHQDVSFWFCSLACAAAVASNPQFHVPPATAWRRDLRRIKA